MKQLISKVMYNSKFLASKHFVEGRSSICSNTTIFCCLFLLNCMLQCCC